MTIEAAKPFLDVEKSVRDQIWRDRLDARSRHVATAIAQTSDVPELVSRVLAGRGVEQEDAEAFLNPSIRDLMPDPAVLTQAEEAAERIGHAITAGEQVAIFGDYDVDGASASALLYRFLTHYGVESEIYIPDRIFEGYGPNPTAIADLQAWGAKLIVTVDCGATSFEALEEAKRLGVDVVVLDHHQMGAELPPAVALVNPNRQDDLSGLGHLCAAGVVFMVLVALARRLRAMNRIPAPPDLLQLLDLVALATVCDVVPLTGLNRAFVVKGMQIMKTQQNQGLAALSRIARLSGPPEAYHLGFVLGPRINAGGRIGDASLGARLLTTQDSSRAEAIAEQLEALNRERQSQEARMLEEAIAEAEAEIGAGEGPGVLVVESDDWHPGIVGLIASRLKDRFRRPAFAIHFDGNGRGSGSGRSITGVDLGAAVRAAREEEIIEKGGGHAMAAGITLRRAQLATFRAFVEEKLASKVAAASQLRELKIDGALTARSASFDLNDLLERAGPFGAGNPAPVFAFPAHIVRNARVVGRDHVSVALSAGDGATLSGIAFRAADTPLGQLLLNPPARLHVAGILSADLWQGRRRMQLRISDAAVPQGSVS